MLKTLTPNLMVDDVKKTVDWYSSVLGFTADAEVPGEGEALQFAIMHRDDVQLMFQSRKSLTSDLPVLDGKPIGGQTLYIEVGDIEALRRSLQGQVEIVKDMHETFYGTREFYFADCNGTILSYSEELTA